MLLEGDGLKVGFRLHLALAESLDKPVDGVRLSSDRLGEVDVKQQEPLSYHL